MNTCALVQTTCPASKGTLFESAESTCLEYSQLHKKAYNLVVCEFGTFDNVLRNAGIRTIPP